MLYAVILASEIAFWSLLVGGLFVRYAQDRPRAGAAMLLAAASTDVIVLMVAAADLADGATAQTSHLIAAATVAYSVVYARRLVAIADRFVLRRLGRDVVEPPRLRKAERERAGWYRHARMWALGVALLGAGFVVAGPGEGDALAAGAGIWTVILAIDILVSFSYSAGGGRDRGTSTAAG